MPREKKLIKDLRKHFSKEEVDLISEIGAEAAYAKKYNEDLFKRFTDFKTRDNLDFFKEHNFGLKKTRDTLKGVLETKLPKSMSETLSSRIINSYGPALKRFSKKLPGMAGMALTGAAVISSPSAEAKSEAVFGSMGVEGASSPEELEMERFLMKKSRDNTKNIQRQLSGSYYKDKN